MEVIKMNFFKV